MLEENLEPIKKIKNYISFSEYSSFNSCQHKYYLSYILGIKGSNNETLFLGNLIHSCLEIIALNKGYDTKNVFLESFIKNLESQEEDFREEMKLREGYFYETFSKIENSLDFHNRYKDFRVIDVEYKLFEFLFNYEMDWYFKGFIDLILYSDNEECFYFIDWKTSGKPWDLKKKLKDKNFINQLNLYKYFYAKANNIPLDKIKTKYVALVYNTSEIMELEVSSSIKEIEDVILDIKQTILNIQTIDKNKLTKMRHGNNKFLCNWCSFYNTNLCNDFIFQKIKI